jgi:RsiW-degrading membrane proteinase PrsW (M82 family)
MEFKPLELKTKEGKLKRLIKTPHIRRSVLAVLIGAIIGFLLFYFSEGRTMEHLPAGEILKSILVGGFFGFFITNSPCARGRC